MLFLAAFWIAIYCPHPNRCDVYKADDGVKVKQYTAVKDCKADKALIHPNSDCLQVNSVSCFQGGSACTFDPADDVAWRRLHDMVPLPK